MNRSAGVLLSITSLPSRFGIGCLDQAAYDFVNFLVRGGQSYWQILPLGPTGFGKPDNSPYQAFSAFAGNPFMINLEELIAQGLLSEEECEELSSTEDAGKADYASLTVNRYQLLRRAYERSDINNNWEYHNFLQENGWWVEDYALFMALKNFFGMDKIWYEWPEDIRLRWDNAMSYYREHLYYDIEFQKFMQYVFYRQWWNLKRYANERNIKIIGDIPIYVSLDSADVWAHPELFQLDSQGYPTAISGCPPDAFAAGGQIWNNPLYRWDYHRDTDYSWWVSRMYNSFRLYDVIRIDHFRGFDEYFSIPANATSALEGHWEKGPNMDLFRRIEAHLGRKAVIAEDLGLLTDTVRWMVGESGFPNMKVFQFGFEKDDIGAANDYLPHNYTNNCVAYTGTHDNDTIRGWFTALDKESREYVREYIGDLTSPIIRIHWSMIKTVMRSIAPITIIPMQDYLGLENTARMNVPSTVGTNWTWRLVPGQVTDELADQIHKTTAMFARLNWENEKK